MYCLRSVLPSFNPILFAETSDSPSSLPPLNLVNVPSTEFGSRTLRLPISYPNEAAADGAGETLG